MDNFIDTLINGSLGNIMDKSRDSLLLEDGVYIQDCADMNVLEKRYNALDLNQHDRNVINDLIACIGTVNSRIADISYIAGACDTVKLLNRLKLLKEHE